MTLLAAVKALLFRYTGATDLIVASPVADVITPRRGTDRVLHQHPRAERHRRSVRQFRGFRLDRHCNTTSAIEHQAYLSDRCVDGLTVGRDPSRMPICDVTVVMANASTHVVALPGAAVREFVRDYDASKYDLHFVFDDRAGDIDIAIVYNTDLFRRDRIQRTIDHLRTMLRMETSHPECAIYSLPIMEPSERELIRRGFNPGTDATTVRQLTSGFADTASRTRCASRSRSLEPMRAKSRMQ